jgi:hypothetical protein
MLPNEDRSKKVRKYAWPTVYVIPSLAPSFVSTVLQCCELPFQKDCTNSFNTKIRFENRLIGDPGRAAKI